MQTLTLTETWTRHQVDHRSHHILKQGKVPAWWQRLYTPGSSGASPSQWGDLMEEVQWPELCSSLRRVKETSPGLDNLTPLVLKTAVFNPDDPPTLAGMAAVPMQLPPPGPTATALLLLLNIGLKARKVTDWESRGITTMCPKKDKDGNPTSLPGEMRPITVLHATLRLRHKILANRLQQVLAAHPTLLHPANRGFIWGGQYNKI